MHVTAIIAAGGRGQRFGSDRPKQLLQVGGRPMLERSVGVFLTHPAVTDVVVALPQQMADDPPAYLSIASKTVRIVVGGLRRQDSVANAFAAVPATSDIIVIHDAARPFASADLISRTINAAAESGAAIAAVQSRDTVKRVDGLKIRSTLPRETIYLAQTPQAFRRDVLRDALALATDATDEASLAEQAGHAVRIVEGEATNIKITTREDLVVAEALASFRMSDLGLRNNGVTSFSNPESAIHNPQSELPARTGRAGVGYDLHRLVEGRPLILGGITIPFDRGLVGHSDADAVCHAITDAVLGAAAAGDIGGHFPDTDPTWKDASSVDLLQRAAEIVRDRGFEVGNVDVSVIAERPKLAPYIDAMRARVAKALGIDIDRVSIKGKTNEGIGELGRGEAIAVHAIALVRSA